MAQESASIEGSKFAKPVNNTVNWQRGGLRWKISVTFGGLILVLGLMVIGIVYHFTGSALQKQVDLRSAAIATNLADAAASLVSKKNTLELDAMIAKYGRLDGVAYALVQDPKGEILASSMQPFPTELKDSTSDTATASLSAPTTRGRRRWITSRPTDSAAAAGSTILSISFSRAATPTSRGRIGLSIRSCGICPS